MATILVNDLATTLGKTVPAGKPATWAPADLLALQALLDPLASKQPEDDEHRYLFDGSMPGWLAVALVHGVHPQNAALKDPRIGAVGIPKLTPQALEAPAEGDDTGASTTLSMPLLLWSVKEGADFSYVEFVIPGGTFDVAKLGEVVPPLVTTTKGIVLSGRGPLWLTAAVAMAYHALSRWVACYQPASPPNIQPPTPAQAICAMTHWPQMKLGTVIPDALIQTVKAGA